MKDDMIKWLEERLDSVCCDTCKNYTDCDAYACCNRNSIKWQISNEEAETIVNTIAEETLTKGLTNEQKNYIYWLILEYRAKKDLLEDDEILILDHMRDEMDIDTVEESLLIACEEF